MCPRGKDHAQLTQPDSGVVADPRGVLVSASFFQWVEPRMPTEVGTGIKSI